MVSACHDAWSTRDLDRLLTYYSPNMVYICNAEPSGAHPVRYVGLEAFRGFLAPVLELIESVSVVEGFQFSGNTARATIACYMKHFATGIVLSGQYRQVFQFTGDRISQLEEYHDAARIATFWELVTQTEAMLPNSSRGQ